MYSTLNFSKHINPYNFILWFFIDGHFFCCLKVRLKTGKETAWVLREELGPNHRHPSAPLAQLLSGLEISTHNHLPQLSWYCLYQSVGNRAHPPGQSTKVKCCVSRVRCSQLLGVFKQKLNGQSKWIQSNGMLETGRPWGSFLSEILWLQQNTFFSLNYNLF